MEKRLFYTFLATVLFLIGYSYLMSKYFPKTPPVPPAQQIQQNETIKKEDMVLEEENNLPQTTLGNFVVTYSPRGGYIKKLELLAYHEILFFQNIGIMVKDKDVDFKAALLEDRIVFTADDGRTKEFSFNGYILTLKVTPPSSNMDIVFSNILSNNGLEQGYQEFFYYEDNNFARKNLKQLKEKTELLKNIQFAGFRDRYFCLSLLRGSYGLELRKDKKMVYALATSPLQEISFYIGPQIEKELKPLGLEGVINYGFFHSIGMVIVWIMHFLYSLTKSWGLSIILLTMLIYTVLFPFTMQSTKAMKKMAEIQPAINALKEKYKNDLQKFQKEQVELFKKYKINPLGGCLPMLFQIPVFFALFQVFSRFVELKGVHFLWIKDLTLPDRAFKIPFNFPFFGEYINLLPIFMVILSFFQQKVTTPSSTASEQKTMSLFLLIFMGVIFYNFASCLVLYWFIQNLLTFAYQARAARIKYDYSCPV